MNLNYAKFGLGIMMVLLGLILGITSIGVVYAAWFHRFMFPLVVIVWLYVISAIMYVDFMMNGFERSVGGKI